MKVALAVVLCFSLVCGKLSENYCASGDCVADPSYPQKILDFLGLWRFEFDEDLEIFRHKRSLDSAPFLVEAKLCQSECSIKRPQKLKNVNNEMRTIVNHENYTQAVTFEICSTENFPCTFNVFPNSVRSFCQQKYTIHKLLAFDEVKKCVVNDKFLIPSSCDCMIDQEDLLKDVKKNNL